MYSHTREHVCVYVCDLLSLLDLTHFVCECIFECMIVCVRATQIMFTIPFYSHTYLFYG